MSRSRKKVSHYCDYSRNYTRWTKRDANKKVRRHKGELANGNQYKKLYCTWNIRDYVWIQWGSVERIDDDWKESYHTGFRK